MTRYESQCVDCGLPYIGNACRCYKVKMECDECGEECEKLYVGLSGRELCAECALEELEVIE